MRRLAVIGYPVGHSRSPQMQNAALRELGLAGEYEYDRVEVAPAEFAARVREMAAGEYVGANVTVPHKEAALALADTAGAEAEAIGAANTLVFEGDAIVAANTDAGGLLRALARAGAPRGGRALVLGAGGAARAAVWALARGGAGVEPLAVDIWNRTAAKAAALHRELGGRAELGGEAVERPRAAEYAVLVNTTAVGLRGEDPFAELPLSRDGFAPGQVVVDMVYGERPSAILAAAAAAGAATVDGLEMLVQQGALSLELWTGREAPIEAMRAAARGGGPAL